MADWQRSRLIPTGGIGSEKEAEVRATSALLAVMSIVRPFSKTLLDPLGASKAQNAVVDTFVEVPFKTGTKDTRPDGLIRVQHGSKPPWTALVEVKTHGNSLNAEQINAYWDLAREHGYDAIITISNEMASAPGIHPTAGLKVRANSKVQVHHWSWFMILTLAAVERDHRGIADPEQSWILNELIRYLRNPSSGALAFNDMGEHWTPVRDAAREGTLNKRSEDVADIVARWDQLLRYLSLRLSTETGASVQQVLSKAHRDNPAKRSSELLDEVCGTGTLSGAIRIPNAAGDLELRADLRAQRITATTEIEAPQDRGTKARINWIVRQLDDAPDDLVIECWAKNARSAAVATPLARLRDDPTIGAPPDLHDLVRFRLVMASNMGRNRRPSGRSPSFIEAFESLTMALYANVLQGIHQWTPSAPKIEKAKPSIAEEENLPPELIEQLPKEDPAEVPAAVEAPWWLEGGTEPTTDMAHQEEEEVADAAGGADTDPSLSENRGPGSDPQVREASDPD